MKTFFPCLFFLFCFSIQIKGQTIEIEQDEPFEIDREQVFAPLDMSEINTGLLWDYSVQLIPLERWNGLTLDDTTKMNEAIFGLMYATIKSSAIEPTFELPDPDIYLNIIDNHQANDPIPIGILAQDYYRFKKNALINNLIDTLSGQLHDVPNRPESPYIRDVVYVGTPLIPSSDILEVSFNIPSTIVFSNLQSPIQSIYIDFGNEEGFVPINLDQTVTINYTEGGEKTLVIKSILTDGSEWLSHSLFYINTVGGGSRYGNNPDFNPAILTLA